jgi:hypothetical protein
MEAAKGSGRGETNERTAMILCAQARHVTQQSVRQSLTRSQQALSHQQDFRATERRRQARGGGTVVGGERNEGDG